MRGLSFRTKVVGGGLLLGGLLASCLVPLSCERGPATTDTKSDQFNTLEKKVAFLERYLSIRRSYDSLDFAIHFLNGSGGMVPSPSEWDIRLVATVPADELNEWISENQLPTDEPPDLAWLESIPNAPRQFSIDEWYVEPGRIVGINRQQRLIIYRLFAY